VGSTLPRQGFAGGVGAPQPQQQQQFSPLAVTGRGINAAVRNSGLSREQQARVMQLKAKLRATLYSLVGVCFSVGHLGQPLLLEPHYGAQELKPS
jgi:hypothetical protein